MSYYPRKSYSRAAPSRSYRRPYSRSNAASSYSTRVSGSGAYKLAAPRAARKVPFSRAPRVTSAGKSMRNYGASIGGMGGTVVGARFGMPGIGGAVGSALGRGAGALISKLTGHGDYKINTQQVFNMNSLMSAGSSSSNISFGNGSIRIRHREYIQDITSSTAFSNLNLDINPGLQQVFPFLSQLAENFETYKMHGLVFEFKSTSADALNSTNTALGVIGLCVQYNATSANFVNKQQAEAYEGCVSGKPAESMLCGVECAPGNLPLHDLYVRNGPVPGGQDQKTYDMGNLNVFSQGSQAIANVGELWVCYDVTLSFPKLQTDLFTNLLWQHWQNTAGIASAAPFGSFAGGTLIVNNPTNTPFVSISGRTITWLPSAPTGVYKITYIQYGASTATNGFTVIVGSNFTAITNILNDSISIYQTANSTTINEMMFTYVYYTAVQPYNIGNSSYLLYPTTTMSSPSSMDLWVEQQNILNVL